jgi:hypothetical protein
MPRALISSDTLIRSIKPGDPRKRLNDGDGLYLLLFVNGGAHGWRFDYVIHGRRKTLSLGTYPNTGLKLARAKATQAREMVAAGTDPSDHRKATKAEHVQQREMDQRDRGWLAHDRQLSRRWRVSGSTPGIPNGPQITETRSFGAWRSISSPGSGKEPVASITPVKLLEVLRRIEARGVIETAHRALENCGQVFRYAVATGRAVSNPARDLKDALRKPMVKHFPAITDPKRLGELLRACDNYQGTHVVRAALHLAPMLLLRPGELRHARWEEFDLDAAVWLVPAARMKQGKAAKLYGKPHTVPLPSQAVQTLRELHNAHRRWRVCLSWRATPRPTHVRKHGECVTSRNGFRRRRSGGTRLQSHGAHHDGGAPRTG